MVQLPPSKDDTPTITPRAEAATRSWRLRKGAHPGATGRAGLLPGIGIAAAACLFAALTKGAPTEIHLLDTVLKVLVALVCVLAGRRTPWALVAIAAAVAAAASYGSPGALVAVAAFGLSAAGWWTTTRAKRAPSPPAIWTIVRMAACGSLANLALRASWPRVTLSTSLVAALIVVLIVIPGIIWAPRRTRRAVLVVGGLAAAAALGLTALAGVAIYRARAPLQSALNDARGGLVAAEHGDRAAAVSDFKLAESAAHSAENDLVWARPAEIVPIVSQQVRAIRTAAFMGAALSRAGVRTASTASVRDLKFVNGAFPVRRLQALEPVFREDLSILQSVSRETSTFRSPWIVAPLKTKLSSVERKLEQATHEARVGLLATEEVPGLLGADGPRTYLVLVENPAESRASGGIVGDYAELSANAGHLHLVDVGGVGQLNTNGIPPSRRSLPPIPDFVDRYGAYLPQDHWENVPMSPNFPTVGAVASYLFPQSGGTKVDGVISVDPVAMAGLLQVVGPVTATGASEPLTASNAVAYLANQEFIDFTNNARRIAFLQSLLKQVWQALTTRPLPSVPTLVRDLAPAVDGGHILMYSPSPPAESFFRQVHLAGAMPPVHGDFVGVVTQNAAGNKIDWYLRRSITYAATLDLASDTITSTLKVALTNTAPSSGLPPYIIGNFFVAHPILGENLSWVNIYTPWALQSATLDGRPLAMTSQYELGRQVYSATVAIPSGRTDTLVLHLAGTWPKALAHYELGWYHQPMMFPDKVTAKVTVIR